MIGRSGLRDQLSKSCDSAASAGRKTYPRTSMNASQPLGWSCRAVKRTDRRLSNRDYPCISTFCCILQARRTNVYVDLVTQGATMPAVMALVLIVDDEKD